MLKNSSYSVGMNLEFIKLWTPVVISISTYPFPQLWGLSPVSYLFVSFSAYTEQHLAQFFFSENFPNPSNL